MSPYGAAADARLASIWPHETDVVQLLCQLFATKNRQLTYCKKLFYFLQQDGFHESTFFFFLSLSPPSFCLLSHSFSCILSFCSPSILFDENRKKRQLDFPKKRKRWSFFWRTGSGMANKIQWDFFHQIELKTWRRRSCFHTSWHQRPQFSIDSVLSRSLLVLWFMMSLTRASLPRVSLPTAYKSIQYPSAFS